MHILPSLLNELKKEFIWSRIGNERGSWFICTLLAIIVPFTPSRTSNLLRCLEIFFGFVGIKKKRYYTFMASPKIPWKGLSKKRSGKVFLFTMVSQQASRANTFRRLLHNGGSSWSLWLDLHNSLNHCHQPHIPGTDAKPPEYACTTQYASPSPAGDRSS